MGGLIKRLARLFVAFVVGSAVVGTAAAFVAKRRLVTFGDAESDEISLAAIFEPLDFHSSATSFRGGSLVCCYGGGVLDLRGATLDPAGATLSVRAIFGGGQIVVPESWDVKLSVLPIMGGIGDTRPRIARPSDAPQLRIEGLALFGGFGISSEPFEGQDRGIPEPLPTVN